MDKKSIAKWIAPAALLGAMLTPIAAQADPFHHDHPYPHSVNGRLNHQEHRILEGERHGSLTPREAARLQHREYDLARRDHYYHMTGHHVTPIERARLEREENRNSRVIYHQKHDAQHRW